MVARRPALRFVLFFAAGILLAAWCTVPPIPVFILSLVFILLSGILFHRENQKLAAHILLYASVFLLGILLQTLQQLDFQDREIAPKRTDEFATLYGTIDSEPVRREKRLNFVVSTDSIVREEGVERKSRRVIVMLHLENDKLCLDEIEYGKRIELHGTLEPFPFQRNPGEFDYGKYLAMNDIQGVVSVKGLGNILVKGHQEVHSLRAWTSSTQHALYRIIDGLHSPRHASFLKGIVFGYSADLPSEVKQSFLDTGTIHILAVSGSNVAFVAFMFYSVFGFFRLPRKAVGCAAMAGLLVYMVITGASPSVVRATIMAIVILIGTLLERKADIYNSISVAALILLLWNTSTLFDVGFQLSFAAVISIVYCYPRLEVLIKKIPERFEEIKAIDVIWKLFAVSLAAQIGTIPFTAYYFGRVSIVSLIANIPVVPISGLNTFIGFAEVVFSFISPWIAGLYAAANDFLIWFLLGFVKQAANVSFAYIETWHITAVMALGYYTVLIGAFNLHHVRIRNWIFIILLAVGNVFLFSTVWKKAHENLIATLIDVGQGDCILLDCPNGKHVLIDAGPWSVHFDAGARTIVPFLKRNGITSIDCFIITHPHSDHLGGAASVLRLVHVDTLVLDSTDSNNRQVRECLALAHEKKVGVKSMHAGNQIYVDSSMRMYTFHPPWNQQGQKNLNNSSLVVKVLFGGASILLVGDAEALVEEKLVHRYGKFLSSNVLKVGHHGSLTSTSESFLNTVHPHEALISVGTHNKFRHPSPLILNRLTKNSVEIARTDLQGAIILRNDGKQWVQESWREKL
jgi:competence protein ComEC